MNGSAPTTYCARWLFLRLMGAVYLAAFASLWVQIDGLLGSRGILPAADFLAEVSRVLGTSRYWWLPTLFWIHPSDGLLHLLCGAGVALSILLLIGLAPALALAGLWLLYLSLATIGQDFLSFQWDMLLLEAGFLAIFLAPRESPPLRIVVWLLRWLLFRLMFSSGAVKLLSGDPTWRDLSALDYHYWTQPLPTWIGWYANCLPVWCQRLSCAATLAVELGAPCLIWGGRMPRLIAFAALVGLQLLIFATGNYCFFNLLTIALCLMLLDDDCWPSAVRRWRDADASASPRGAWPRWLTTPVAVLIIFLSVVQTFSLSRLGVPWPGPLLALRRLVAPLRLVSGYGLFAVMTTTRPEIIIEGSDDGEHWLEYDFRWKPGDLKRAPAFVEPHQPRIDWQMWFAALGSYQQNPWFLSFVLRLLEGSPEVSALLERNPFPDHPPKLIRAALYQYRFTDFGESASGDWWKRERQGLYLPAVSRDSFRVR